MDGRLAERVTGSFVNALVTAEIGDVLPMNLSDVGLDHLRRLGAALGRNGAARFEALYVEHEDSATLTAEAADHVARLLKPKSKAIGSIIGLLEMVSVRQGYRYSVYDEVTHRAVRCDFGPDELDAIKAALGQRVMVSGIVHRNEKGQPLRITRSSFRVLPTRDELPTTEQLVGIDPQFTGDHSTDEYVRQLRDA